MCGKDRNLEAMEFDFHLMNLKKIRSRNLLRYCYCWHYCLSFGYFRSHLVVVAVVHRLETLHIFCSDPPRQLCSEGI